MSTPDEYPIVPGDVLLGKYRVERVLGRGGMGLVFAARHLKLDDRVAIKLLLPKLAQDARMVERFLREARASTRIRSQHVARVADVGTLENGAPYMVMDYLEGKDLAEVLAENGRFAVPFAVDLVLQACEALAEAHAQGIVHRDVKPSNLFLTRHADGTACVKVLDFGISKMTHAQEHALTRTGGMLGSPLYMSPEQIRSLRDVDGRADIYSMGVVLFELLTQAQPFQAEDLAQLIYKVMHDEPETPRALRADIPEPVERAILRAIKRERDDRFRTIADFALALVPFASSHTQTSAELRFSALRTAPPANIPWNASSLAVSYPPSPPSSTTEGTTGGRVRAAVAPLEDGTLTIAPVDSTSRAFGLRAKRTAPLAIGIGVVVVASGLFLWRLSGRRPSSDAEIHAVEASPQPAVAAFAVQPSTEPPKPVEPSGSVPVPPSAAPSARASVPTKLVAPKRVRPNVTAAPTTRSAPPAKRATPTDPFKRDVF